MSAIAKFPKSNPPLTALVAAEYAKLDRKNDVKFTPKNDTEQTLVEVVFYPQGDILRGDHTIARYLAKKDPSKGLYGSSGDAFNDANIEQWLDFASSSLSKSVDAAALKSAAETLNTHLTLRTFFSAYNVTLADIAVWAALTVHPAWAELSASSGHALEHLRRWFDFCDSLPEFQAVATKFAPKAKAATGEQPKGTNLIKKPASKAKYDELEGAVEGKVVTRFPPEPSGYLHMGHVKAALLNLHYARHYKGKLILRFDDTNPAKENDDFVDSITYDLKTLGFVPDQVTYTSDYFDKIIELGEKLIKDGKAYIDLTPAEQMKADRKAMIDSPYRNSTVEENLALWKEMKAGTAKGMQCAMRAKIDMKSKNGCLRDPTFFRVIINPPHHRTGNKYKVYPIYDFACPVVDSLEGVSHALRSNEYHDRDAQYEWVLDAIQLPHRPRISDFSRLNFQFTLLSKRKLQWFVNQKIVEGWDSPAFPTVRGVLRRGLTVEALHTFIQSQGSSSRSNLQEMEKLWALNKQVIDRAIPRYTAIAQANKVPFTLSNGPTAPFTRSIPRMKLNEALGEKVVTYTNRIFIEQEDARVLKVNEEVTLMDWGNAIVRVINKADDGTVTSIEGELHLEGDYKKTEWKLTWLSDIADLVPVKLVEYDYLITKSKLDEHEDFTQWVNSNIINVTYAIGDPNLRSVKKGERFQLERRGYFIVDEPFMTFGPRAGEPVVLIMIPDGKADTQSHLSTKVKPKAKTEKTKPKGKSKDVQGLNKG